jgi:WD40 repeat protein
MTPAGTLKGFAVFSMVAMLAACAAMAPPSAGRPEYLVVGIDNKVAFGDDGALQFLPPGKDSVAIVDIGTDPANPRVVTTLPLMNSVIGPPTNLAITPDGTLALVANSLDWVQDGANWKGSPDTKLFVIDLTTHPPTHIDTVAIGKQPSGLSINASGDMALVANRADNSITVLSIRGKQVKVVDSVAMGEMVSAVVISSDGKRAYAAKFPGHKIALLEVDGMKVTYGKRDLPVGLWPYNLGITPDGKLAISADNGNAGRSDGHVDTVTVVDLETNPPRAIDKVVVGDSPEGFVMSPTGRMAAAILLGGSDGPKNAWFYHRNGAVAVLKIDGKRVSKVGEVAVGAVPEGAVFSPDGRWLYVGNYSDRNISVLRVDGDTVVNTGTVVALPGKPASMRGRSP